MRTAAVVGALAALVSSSSAILVVQGSPCDQYCGNVLSATHTDDLVCSESQYTSTSAGIVFEACTKCELTSNYTANGQTDLQWMACKWPLPRCRSRPETNTTDTRQYPVCDIILSVWRLRQYISRG